MESTLNKNFLPYKDIHKDETAVVLATGPTLNQYDYLEVDGQNLVVGVNSIALESIELDYYFCGHIDQRSKPYLSTIGDYKVRKAKFAAAKIEITVRGNERLFEEQEALKLGLVPYELTAKHKFERDISQFKVTNHLIIFSALQFLLFAGVRTIYLVGCDVTSITSHKDFRIMTKDDRDTEAMIGIWTKFKDFTSGSAFPQIPKIVSINPVGLAGFFEDIYR